MSFVAAFVEQGFSDRIQTFDAENCSVQTATDVMDRWAKAGRTTVFMAGTFDLPTPNHRLGLADARLMAASLICGIEYETLNNDTPESVMAGIRQVAGSPDIRLMVTVDTDEGAEQTKAFNPDKADCPRPIFTWKTRAHNLASYTVPSGEDTFRSTVDYITAHGPNACQACPDCASIDNALMATRLRPSLLVVNAASTDTLDAVFNYKAQGLLPGTTIGITNEDEHQFVDELIGGRVSGTAIIRRAKTSQPGGLL